MKAKAVNYMSTSMVILSLIGILFYKDAEGDFYNLGLVLLFVVGFALTIPHIIKREIRKVESGEIKVAVKEFHTYELTDIFLSIVGLLIFVFSLYDSIKATKIDSYGIVFGLILFARVFLNKSRYFIMLDGKNLIIKGVSINIKKISKIRIYQNFVHVYKNDTIKEFAFKKLDEKEKKEVIDFLVDSDLKDKIYVL